MGLKNRLLKITLRLEGSQRNDFYYINDAEVTPISNRRI